MKKISLILASALLIAVGTLVSVKAVRSADAGGPPTRVTLCKNGQTIEVVAAAVPALLASGATMGPCPGDCMGEPLTDVYCVMLYEPVCGCDGNTYSNSCLATVAGVSSWTAGACGGGI